MTEQHVPHTAPGVPTCPKCAAAECGVEVCGIYDGVLFWACTNPGCDHVRNRWAVIGGGKVYVQAEEHMRRWREQRQAATS